MSHNKKNQNSRLNIKRMAIFSVFAALAYLSVLFIRIPITPFLDYEVKDVFITISGFLFGSLSVFWLSLIVSFVEMITISGTGMIGFVMNFFATFTFAFTASVIYQKKSDCKGEIIGLSVGSVSGSAWMVVFNALITPLFLGMPVHEVWNMLLVLILPFNLMKTLCNSVLSFLLFKPVFAALTSARLLDRQEPKENQKTLVAAIALCVIGLIGAFVFLFCL